MRSLRPTAIGILLAAAIAALFGWQHHQTGELGDAIERARVRIRERDELRSANRRLAAAQPGDAEMENLVNRLTQAEQLKAQLAALRAREDAAAKASAAAPRDGANAAPSPSLRAGSVSVERWQNVGQGTADATLETALWAAANGELDALAATLALDATGRAEAAALFSRLPASVQAEMATPERMVALLTASDVPLGRAAILRQQATPDGMDILTQLTDADGHAKTAMFSFKSEGESWRLQVPASVVRKYAATWNGSGR